MEVDAQQVINRLAQRLAQAHSELAVAEVRAEQAEARVKELEDSIRNEQETQ